MANVNQYHNFVGKLEQLVKWAERLSPKPAKGSLRWKPYPSAPKALIFSAHPDDECIVGGLALRLLRETKWNVVNVAVTLGSKKERRAARLRELKRACGHLGFELIVAGGKGLENVNINARKRDPKQWAKSVAVIADILLQNRPRAIFTPHALDGHATHIGTHHLVMDALRSLPADFECFVVETELWAQITAPNLMVEVGTNDLADLITALSFHVGEVKRNPYHLRLPAWMMDNVRRAEVVGGFGSVAPDFTFATIYRLRKWKHGGLVNVLADGKYLSCAQNPEELFA